MKIFLPNEMWELILNFLEFKDQLHLIRFLGIAKNRQILINNCNFNIYIKNQISNTNHLLIKLNEYSEAIKNIEKKQFLTFIIYKYTYIYNHILFKKDQRITDNQILECIYVLDNLKNKILKKIFYYCYVSQRNFGNDTKINKSKLNLYIKLININ